MYRGSALTESLVRRLHQQQIRVFTNLPDHDDAAEQYERAARLGVDVIQADHVLDVYLVVAPERLKMGPKPLSAPETHKKVRKK